MARKPQPPPISSDAGVVRLVVEAALPDTGNALTQTKDGDGTLKFALSPRDVPEAARCVASLGGRTFWLAIVEKPERPGKSALEREP